MIAIGLSLLALFSLISALAGSEDPRRTSADPLDDLPFWMRLGLR
jgi:hypothetical protein